jgi:hypothetical protein
MAPLNILRTGFKAVLMRSHAAKYVACVVLACAAAVVVAVPVFGQTTETTATLVGAGDIAKCCSVAKGPQYCATPNELEPADRNYAAQTAALLANIPGTVIAMGDNAYERGTRSQYANCYDNYKLFDYSLFDDRTDWWGQYKARTMPVLGNHEYQNSDDPTRRSKPYFEYFSETTENNVTGFKGPAAPVPNDPANNQFGLTFGKGYYSYDLGTWHIVALNSNCNKVGGCDAGSPQGKWLRHDLKAHPADCTLAYFHHPLYATGNGTNTPEVMPFWTMLHAKGADVILSGHAHRYERHAPITPEGELNPNNGIRQFVVGTGGEPGGSEIDYNQVPNYQDVLEVVQIGTPGVLELDLHSPDLQHPKGSYSWKFHGVPDVPIVGQTFTDQGSDNCH